MGVPMEIYESYGTVIWQTDKDIYVTFTTVRLSLPFYPFPPIRTV